MADALEELSALFRRLGARDPESWARSQLEEGIPQLARFLFLRQAWTAVIGDDDTGWVDAMIQAARQRPDDPGSGAGPALERMLAKGVSREDICTVVRVGQSETLHGLCYLLSDPRIEEPEAQGMSWGLVRLDEDGQPGEPIDGLHESVLETDPTGREMRPKGSR